MAIIPTVRCRHLKTSLDFYTGGLDFRRWGTREFYVDDPDGNTLRFTQVRS